MRHTFILVLSLFFWAFVGAQAGTYTLTDGQTISGEPVSYNENGVVLKTTGNSLMPRTPWPKFSQESLKQFVDEAKRPQDAEFVKPHLEETMQELEQQQKAKNDIVIKQPNRIPRPEGRVGLLAAVASPLGFTIFLVLYLANLYAAYEIGIYRRLPLAIPCGVSAALPLLGPILFLCVPGKLLGISETVPVPAASAQEAEAEAESQTAEPKARQTSSVPSAGGAAASAPARKAPAAGGAKSFKVTTRQMAGAPPSSSTPSAPTLPVIPAITVGDPVAESEAEAAPAVDLPPVVTFKRGEFTFNRRFFETKMPGFFRVVPSEADKDLVLYFKAVRGEFIGKRISKIGASDLHLLTFKDSVTNEEMIPFTEIYEVQIRHKDIV